MPRKLSPLTLSVIRAARDNPGRTSSELLDLAGISLQSPYRVPVMKRFHDWAKRGLLIRQDGQGWQPAHYIGPAGLVALKGDKSVRPSNPASVEAPHQASHCLDRRAKPTRPTRPAKPTHAAPAMETKVSGIVADPFMVSSSLGLPAAPAADPSGEPTMEDAIAIIARQLGERIMDGAMQHIAARLREHTLPMVELDIGRAAEPDEPDEPAKQAEQAKPDEPAKPPASEARPNNEARRPRALIVGLLPGQQDIITREFGRELDLRFVTSQAQVSNRAKELSHTSDAAILMTKFVNHAAEDIIKSRGGRLIRVSGGLSQLRDTLTQFYCEQQG